MKNPFRRRNSALIELARLLDNELRDPSSDIRQLFARVARAEAKNAFGTHLDTEIEKFDRILVDRSERALAELGSAGASLDQHVEQALKLAESSGPTPPGAMTTAVAHIRRADEILKEVSGK